MDNKSLIVVGGGHAGVEAAAAAARMGCEVDAGDTQDRLYWPNVLQPRNRRHRKKPPCQGS